MSRIQPRNSAEMNSLKIAKFEKLLYREYSLHVNHHAESITALKLTLDNRYLFTGSEDKKIIQFSLKKSKSKYIFSGHKSEITFIEEHESILYSSDKHSIIIWDLRTRFKLSEFQVSGYITSLALISSLDFLLASNKDGSISVFQTPKGKRVSFSPFKIESIGIPINTLIIIEKPSEDSSKFLLISGHDLGKIVIRSFDSVIEKTLENHKRKVNCLCSNNELLVSGSDDKSLIVWRLFDFQFLSKLEGHSWAVTACLLTPDGISIISASNDNSLIVWQKFVKTFVLKSGSWAFNSIVCNQDGSHVYSAGDDSIVRIWDMNKNIFKTELTGHTKAVTCFYFDLETQFCVTGSRDKTVRVWDLSLSQQKWFSRDAEDTITVVRISDNCKWVVSGCNDGMILVWKLANGNLHSMLFYHSYSIKSLALSPDNNYFTSTGKLDGMLVLWRYKSKRPIDYFYENSVSMCFTRHKRYLVTEFGYNWRILSLAPIRRLKFK